MEDIWNIFSRHLFFSHHALHARIHSFVLMSNHFHLLISTPEGNISSIMRYLMTETSREITFNSGRINQTYGGPYFSSLIESYHYYMLAYKYVYRNPVHAELVARAEDYKFSSLNALLGQSHLQFPILEDETLFNGIEETLSWINTNPIPQHREQVRIALKKQVFSLPRDNVNSRRSILEDQLL